jgi:hypothetical protein
MATNIALTIQRKFEYGKMKIIERIIKEESTKFFKLLSKDAAKGGIWAYDYNNNYTEHSVKYWKKSDKSKGKGTNNRKFEVKIWNDKPVNLSQDGFNYVEAIYKDNYNGEVTDQTSTFDIDTAREQMRETIKDRIRYEVKGKL